MRRSLRLLAASALLLGLACAGGAKPEGGLDDTPRAREHVYVLEHRLLPALLFDDPGRVRDSLEDFGQTFVERCWNQVAEQLPEGERVSAEGLKVTAYEPEPGLAVFIVTFPPPQGVPENYFSAFCFKGEEARYLTLERTFDFGEGPMAVLGEWTSGGHGNYGPLPVLDEAGFLDQVTRLLQRQDEEDAATTTVHLPGEKPAD